MRRRAEVVFIERNFTGRGLPGWDVRLVNPDAVRDEQRNGKPVVVAGRVAGFKSSITYNRPYGSLDGYGEDSPPDGPPRYGYVTQGLHKGGRRYGVARTVTEAQQRVADWARRRFYYED